MKMHRFILPDNKIANRIFYVLISVVTFLMLVGMLYLGLDTDVVKLLPENTTTMEEKNKIAKYKADFPSSDSSIFLSVEYDNMTAEKFLKLKTLCKELESLKIDDDKIVSSILSPFNAVYFKKIGNTFIPKTLFSGNNVSSLDKTMDEALLNRYLLGSVLSYDRKSIAILVNMNEDAIVKGVKNKNIYHWVGENLFGKSYGDKKLPRNVFCNKVDSVLNKYANEFKIYTAGVPVYEAKAEKYMIRDIVLLFTPALFMMVLVLFLNFKTKRGTFLPILGMILSLVWTMGLMGWLRYKINVVGILIPPIILTIGSSYTLHYLNSYYHHSTEKDSRKLVINSSKAIFPTMSMAAITTVIGFISFFTARMDTIRSFGFWIVVSIVFTLFFTFFLLSKVLVKLEPPKDIHLETYKNDFFSKIIGFINRKVFPLYGFWIGLSVAALVVFTLTLGNIKIETNALKYFKSSDSVRKSMAFLQKNFRGTISFNVVVKSKNGQKDFFRTKEGLESARKIDKFINDNPGVDGVTYTGWRISVVTMIEDLNTVMTGNTGLPEDQGVIDRFYNLIKASRNPLTNGLINDDLSAINIQVRTYSDDDKSDNVITEQELAKLNKYYNEQFKKIADEDGNIVVETWGEALLLSRISKYLFDDQVGSLAFTMIFIFITTLVLFKSFYYALISLIPLLFGIMMNFSIMSIFGIPLDVATIMIGAISVGVGIDSSLHFILNYRRILKDNGGDVYDSVKKTLTYTSRPILFASLALVCGFVVFVLSTFRPVYFFGLLIALSMFNCTFATLMILPSYIIGSEKLKMKFSKKG